MRLLFLPYKPASDAASDASQGRPKISHQKHAAREHHRKARLAKQQLISNNQGASGGGQDPTEYGGRFIEWRVENGELEERQPSASPTTFLGAGRLDPFDVYCARKQPLMVHEMLDHAISCQWTLFAPDNSPSSLNTVKRAVMNLAIDSPLLFHTLIFAGATHKAFHQSPTVDNRKSQVLRLTCKGKALQALREALSSPETMCSDEVIFAMVLLASHGSGEKVTAAQHRERRPLAAAQDAQFYASMEYEWSHMNGLLDVIRVKGGLQEISVPGLAFAMASFDTHTAMMFQSKPNFPILMPSAPVLKSWPSSRSTSPAFQRSPYLITGFDFLSYTDVPQAGDLLNVLRGMRDVTVGFDSYQQGEPNAPSIKQIIFARNLNQHELISLDDLWLGVSSPESEATSLATTDQGSSRGIILYELSRISALIFQIVALLPNLHSVPAVTMAYADRLKDILIYYKSSSRACDRGIDHELLLWATILGAWLTQGMKMRSWFVDHLAGEIIPLVVIGNLSELYESSEKSWELARSKMERFLWLESECEAPCRAIWEEVEASVMPDAQCVIS